MSKLSSRVAFALLLAFLLAGGLSAAQAESPAPRPTPGTPVNPGTPAAPAAPAANIPAPVVSPAAAANAEAPPVEIAPLPGGLLVPGSEFHYDKTGRRDPFKSLLQLEKKQRDITQLPPIQQFDVEAAKVVGVIVDPGRGAQAMVRAPAGQTFVVSVGTVIGKNEGEVVEITLQGIRIVEKFLDFMKRETRKETILKSHPTAVK